MKHSRPSEPLPPVRTIGSLALGDGRGTLYTFRAYPVRARPAPRGTVAYGFCRLEGAMPVPLYIGVSGGLRSCLAGHEMLGPALGLGAVYLLVHRPDPEDAVPAAAVAERLAMFHRPVLNGETADLSAWLPEPLRQQAAEGSSTLTQR